MSEYHMSCSGAELDEAISKVKNGYILPSGQLEFTQNGEYDVTELAQAIVNVSSANIQCGFLDAGTNNYTSYTLTGLSGEFNSLIMLQSGQVGNIAANEYRMSRLIYIPDFSESSHKAKVLSYNQSTSTSTTEYLSSLSSSNIIFDSSNGTCQITLPSNHQLRYQYVWIAFNL